MDNQINEILELYNIIGGNKKSLLEYTDKNPLKVMMNPLPDMFITSKYNANRGGKLHKGVDLRAQSGTKFYSPSSGVVIDSGFYNNSCGGTLRIKHEDGFESVFCHVKELFVNSGDNVKPQEELGLTGGNADDYGHGNSQNAHLHYALKKNGDSVNPMIYTGSIEEVVSSDPRFENLDIGTKDQILSGIKKFFTTGNSGLKIAGGLAGLYLVLDKAAKSKSLTDTPKKSTSPTEWPEDYTAKYIGDLIRNLLPG